MKPRTLFIGLAAALLAGCGHSNSALVGSWTGLLGATNQTLKLNADATFTLGGTSPMKGTWASDGNDLILHKDISNGGDVGFGDGGDGGYHFALSADGKTLTSAPEVTPKIILSKQ